MEKIIRMTRSRPTLVLAGALLLGACGEKPDQLRSVISYEMSSCDSQPTTDPAHLAAADKFKDKVIDTYFTRTKDGLFAANRADKTADSALRQYRGPFYTYIHPLKVTDEQRAQRVQWAGMLYLHAQSVRVRPNGKDWNEWERVRTRNFLDNGRTADGLGRWKCLLNAEIAWAQITEIDGVYRAEVQAVGAYEGEEIMRSKPAPSPEEISGAKVVAALLR
jgi:hypothetical protein